MAALKTVPLEFYYKAQEKEEDKLFKGTYNYTDEAKKMQEVLKKSTIRLNSEEYFNLKEQANIDIMSKMNEENIDEIIKKSKEAKEILSESIVLISKEEYKKYKEEANINVLDYVKDENLNDMVKKLNKAKEMMAISNLYINLSKEEEIMLKEIASKKETTPEKEEYEQALEAEEILDKSITISNQEELAKKIEFSIEEIGKGTIKEQENTNAKNEQMAKEKNDIVNELFK